MFRFAVRRLLQTIPVLFVIITATFFMVRFVPGGPFTGEKAIPPEIMKNLEAHYGLDQPLWKQYVTYLGSIVRGDLGPSFKYPNRTVNEIIALKLPVLGDILRKVAVARFCRTLSTLTSSGVPILDGLEITAKTAGNTIVEDAIMAVRKAVEEGKTLADPLGQTKVFPSMVVQMIGVGEQTGAMDQMLQKIADFYEEEVDASVSALTSLIEPIMMAFLGVVVGGLIIAMYLPIFKLAGNIQT